jgi:hypothetical protein
MLYYLSSGGFETFRCGKLPEAAFTKEEVPHLFAKEVARVTGINVPADETEISWDHRLHKPYDEYADSREYFMNDGFLGWDYLPKTRIPGRRWRWNPSWFSHEVSAACIRIRLFEKGFLTVEERLTRWGIVLWISTKIQEFQNGYSDRPEEWARILNVLDVREEDIRIALEFTRGMHLLNPISDLIPIRVLEVVTVFRVLFRLSLQLFEQAYNASM